MGAFEDGAGVDSGASEDPGVGVGVGVGVDTGASDVGSSVADGSESAEVASVLPVPVACRFIPWCRYSSIPSMWSASSILRADESAMRARSVNRSHDCRIVLSMFDGCRNESVRRCGVWASIWLSLARFHRRCLVLKEYW